MNRREAFAMAALAGIAGPALAVSASPTSGVPTVASPLFPDDVEFWFETQRMFGADEYGGASFGEVLATTRRIRSGDYASWYDAWNATADRVAAEGDAQAARGHGISGRDSWLRASSYYRASDFFLHATPADARVVRAWQRSVACYREAAVQVPTDVARHSEMMSPTIPI